MTHSETGAQASDTGSDSPKITFEEVYEKYDHTVRAVIVRHIPPELGSVDDLSQEIWTQFLEGKDGRPYTEIYDPTKGAFSTFIWEFTRTRCMQFLSRSKRTPTARAYSIQSQPNEEFQKGIVDPETTEELGFNEYEHIEFNDLLRQAELAVHRHRIRGRRDLRWVWYLVKRGFRQDQIAKEMELSEGTISICMDLIRDIPEVQELKKWAVEKGILSENSPL